jgi:multiple sugar transport system substrate-binding protein
MLKGGLGLAAGLGLGRLLTLPDPPLRKYPGRIRVNYWHMLGDQFYGPMNHVVDLFNQSQEKYEVVPLLLPSAGGDADSKFLMSVVGGDPPDVMLQWTNAMATWAEAGILHPLDTLMPPQQLNHFLQTAYPVVRKSGWYKGHLYGLIDGFDFWACYYRPDHFREAGLDPDHFPKTLEELALVGRKLTRFDKAGNIMRVGFLPSGLSQFVASFGGSFYDEKTGQLLLNTPQNLRALTFIVEERKRLGLDKVLRFNAGLSSDSGASWPFISGAYSVIVDGEWRVQQMAQFAPQMEYRTAPIPAPAGGKRLASFSGPNFLTIPKGAQQVEGAWEFMEFFSGLNNPERAAAFYVAMSWLPLSPLSTSALVYQAFLNKLPQYRTFLDLAASENIALSPPVPDQVYIMDRVQWAEDMATRGTLTPQQALEALEADIARERQRRKEMGYAA